MTLRRLHLSLVAAALVTACAAHEDADAKEPKVEPREETPPEPKPKPKPVVAKVAISSVQMIQDCPDPPPASGTPSAGAAPSAASPPAKPASDTPAQAKSEVAPRGDVARERRAPGPGGFAPIKQPCTQSMMQLSFIEHGPQAGKVEIKEVRMFAAANELATLKARAPMAWTGGSYQAWDETLAPDAKELKASYRLSVPDWGHVEKATKNASSYSTQFVLEVDVEIDGVLQTVRSPGFVREREHVIVT